MRHSQNAERQLEHYGERGVYGRLAVAKSMRSETAAAGT